MEEYAYVLDFIPYGERASGSSIVQLIGEKFFVLLDAVVKENMSLAVGDRVYVGKELEKRDMIRKIRGRIFTDQLTGTANQNMVDVIKKIISNDSKKYLDFVNHCGPISIRVHQLELIPGIGKKNIKTILEEREKKPFESFDEIRVRVHSWLDPIGSMAERIKNEISGSEKYNIFVIPLPKEPHF
jgi:putative nucleotide binding protein